MKRLDYILISSAVVMVTAASVYASCVPTYDQVLMWYSGCQEDRTIYKKEQFHITFPDGFEDFDEPEGWGCCHPFSEELKCEPEFNTPVVTDGRWEVTITDQRCTSGPGSGCGSNLCCSPLNSRIYWLERTCCMNPPACESPTQSSFINCCCLYQGSCVSPIVIDIEGNGFALTDAANGVDFDLTGDGTVKRYGWTASGTDDAWLAMDRNNNGIIDDGRELFGNFTPQSPPPTGCEKNGFIALAEYDKANVGGNADGRIDSHDRAWSDLLLWQDTNHNGKSEQSELHKLSNLRVESIDLEYKEAKQLDQYGNNFRYRAKVRDLKGAEIRRWAWDVFLVSR